MNRRALFGALIIGIPIGTTLGWTLSEWMLVERRPAPPSLTQMQRPVGTPFSLTDHKGHRVTDATFAGSVRLVFFGFTHCADVCPTALGYISEVMDGLGDDASGIRPLFISVDSGRDTPELLAGYLTNFHSSITGLTGTEEEVAQAARAFRTQYAKIQTGPDAYVMDHSGSIYLVGASGALRGFLDTHEPIETAIAKARLVLQSP